MVKNVVTAQVTQIKIRDKTSYYTACFDPPKGNVKNAKRRIPHIYARSSQNDGE